MQEYKPIKNIRSALGTSPKPKVHPWYALLQKSKVRPWYTLLQNPRYPFELLTCKNYDDHHQRSKFNKTN